ncbi:hypothetical protein [Sporolituus thermophilus]|uniref:Uncharacterized protein n=1 Tax=Sporolituus thermophilus DSM 23256 TaxID=1123285 RepID=A0A1G7PJ22_9FIRM|nr:hypothetical protein [Sporolituus thermophilus]SDF86218.1 hypothetical protein SAMN05660235_02976 [Sporolituus thermophilus DSM 23256]
MYIIKNIYGTQDEFQDKEELESALYDLVKDEGFWDLSVVDDTGRKYDIVVTIK